MTLPNLPEVPQKATLEQLNQIVAELSQQLTYLLSGFLGSQNILEAGGWRVGPTELQSKDKTVGMSTDKTGIDPVRFWAGDVKTGTPKFKVTEAGIATLVSAILASVASGERVVIDNTGLHCYDSSNVERLTIGTVPSHGVEAVTFRDTAGTEVAFTTYGTETADGASRTGLYIVGPDANYILMEPNGEIRFQCGPTSADEGFRATPLSRPEINDGGGWAAIAKKTEVDAKQDAFTGINGTVYVSSSMGGAIDTAITFTNGVRTT